MFKYGDIGTATIVDMLGKVYTFKDVPRPVPTGGGGLSINDGKGTMAFGPGGYVTCRWMPNEEKDNDQEANDQQDLE